MSGVEVAGLVLGVVPILIEILKSYGRAGEKLRTFKTYHKAVSKIDLDFRLEGRKFRDECDRLLAAVFENHHERQSMLQDPEDRRWRDKDTDHRFQAFLGDEVSNCEELIILIRDLLRETMIDLERVGRLVETAKHKAEGIRRVFDAMHLSVKEGTYKRRLGELSEWNAKLRHLRKRKCYSLTPRDFTSTSALSRKIPSSFSKIREASKALHSSLEEAWTCSNSSHEDHQAKLWLEATENFDSVRLDMAISCRQKNVQTSSRHLRAPIWMYVQSSTMQKGDDKLEIASKSIGAELAMSIQAQAEAQSLSSQPPRNKPSMLAGIKQSKKRVRFDSGAAEDSDLKQPVAKDRKATTPPHNADEQCHSMLDLRTLKSFCSHLNQLCAPPAECKVSCLGFLEMRDSFKFIFYNAGERALASQGQGSEKQTAKPLNKALKDLTRLQRLSLALRLAKAVLHYHSTPWLPKEWRLRDLCFFGEQEQDEQDSLVQELQTLHLSTQFPPKPCADPSSTAPVPSMHSIIPKSRDTEDLYYTYGIKNMTLAGLGLALLEIGHQRDIGSFKITQPHDVISARILMEKSHTQLGGRYHKIAQRCLDCDFSLGGDLQNEGLQSAVYSHVVCELEELIKAHKRFETSIS